MRPLLPYAGTAGNLFMVAVFLAVVSVAGAGAGEAGIRELEKKLHSETVPDVLSSAKVLAEMNSAPAWELLRKAASNRKVLTVLRRPFLERAERGDPHAGKNELYEFFTVIAQGRAPAASTVFLGALEKLEKEETKDEYISVASALAKLSVPTPDMLRYIDDKAVDHFYAGCFSSILATWGTPESLRVFEKRCARFSADLLLRRDRICNARLHMKLSSDPSSFLVDFKCRTRPGRAPDHLAYPPIRPRGREAAAFVVLLKGKLPGSKHVTLNEKVKRKLRRLVDTIHTSNQKSDEYRKVLSEHFDFYQFGKDHVLIPKRIAKPVVFKWAGPKFLAGLKQVNGKLPVRVPLFTSSEWGVVAREDKLYKQVDAESLGAFCTKVTSEKQFRLLVEPLVARRRGRAIADNAMGVFLRRLDWWPKNKFPASASATLDRKAVTDYPVRTKKVWHWSFFRREGPEVVQYKYAMTEDGRIGRLRVPVFVVWPIVGEPCNCPTRGQQAKRDAMAREIAADVLKEFLDLARNDAPLEKWKTLAGANGWPAQRRE